MRSTEEIRLDADFHVFVTDAGGLGDGRDAGMWVGDNGSSSGGSDKWRSILLVRNVASIASVVSVGSVTHVIPVVGFVDFGRRWFFVAITNEMLFESLHALTLKRHELGTNVVDATEVL